jgi:hypothetical protein
VARTVTRRDGQPGLWRRRAAQWYVLASSYALARLLLSRTIAGVWDIDLRFLAELLAVTVVQLAVLELLQARWSTGAASQRVGEGRRQRAAP